MAVSPQSFPPRKRRTAAAAAASPPYTTTTANLNNLVALSDEISTLKPLQPLLKTNSASLIRKVTLLHHILHHLQQQPPLQLPSPALLCFDEMYILLHRIKTLLHHSSTGTITFLLIHIHTHAHTLRELSLDLSILLDVFPFHSIVDLSDDVFDIVRLARKQCYYTDASLDQSDYRLRRRLVKMLDGIKREVVPDQLKLAAILAGLGLTDSDACRDEIERLEEEFHTQSDERPKSEIISLIGLVRYAKCVLYGPSGTTTPPESPSSSGHHRKSSSSTEVNVPADFRCPISLDLMRDPVVVSTGQTYDRSSINLWIQSGHDTCPKTGQTLAHADLIPNLALKSLIALWCRDQRIPFQNNESNERVKSVVTSKTALEVTRMTVSFLVSKLAASQSVEDVNGLVYELRALAKSDSDSRACIADAGGIPLLVRNLGSGGHHPSLQVNAVTAILNLSILEANKVRIVETEGALNGVIEVLRFGATWEAKGNAAATIFSLSSIHSYKKRLGRKARLVKGLLDLAREGPIGSKRDALVAVMNLAGDSETVGKLIDGGVVSVVVDVMNALPEEALTILEMVVKRGGMSAIVSTYNVIRKLGGMLRDGSDQSRESAAATLVIICRKGGMDVVAELAGISGIERVIWELVGSGTERARRKSASLLRILRRWAAGLDGEVSMTSSGYPGNITSTSRIMLPG